MLHPLDVPVFSRDKRMLYGILAVCRTSLDLEERDMQQKSERFEMRLEPATLRRVEDWRAAQPDLPSRAEAIRALDQFGVV